MSPSRLVIVKPVGGACNLRCDYCYYPRSVPREPRVMSEGVLWALTTQLFEATQSDPVCFVWHGGEPTLAGLPWFRRVVELQRELCPPGRRWHNELQTNGLLIDDEWAQFFADERFGVGLSLDGAPHHHRHRRTADGRDSFPQTLRALQALQRHRVTTSLLTVVHDGNVQDPEGVYRFLVSTGQRYLQFLPVAESALAYGKFLKSVFDIWIAEDVGKIVVQNFDEAFRTVVGAPHAVCVHSVSCGNVAVVEFDGSFYACDHFVRPSHRWGSIMTATLSELFDDRRQVAFGHQKAQLAAACAVCPALEFCRGGCPKDRDDQEINRFCRAYRDFFEHARPALEVLAEHWSSGRPLRSFVKARG